MSVSCICQARDGWPQSYPLIIVVTKLRSCSIALSRCCRKEEVTQIHTLDIHTTNQPRGAHSPISATYLLCLSLKSHTQHHRHTEMTRSQQTHRHNSGNRLVSSSGHNPVTCLRTFSITVLETASLDAVTDARVLIVLSRAVVIAWQKLPFSSWRPDHHTNSNDLPLNETLRIVPSR